MADVPSLLRESRKIAPKLEGGVLIQTLCDALEERERENEMWRRVWKAMEEKLEQAPVGEEPLEFWGGYRAALLDIRDLAASRSQRGEGG